MNLRNTYAQFRSTYPTLRSAIFLSLFVCAVIAMPLQPAAAGNWQLQAVISYTHFADSNNVGVPTFSPNKGPKPYVGTNTLQLTQLVSTSVGNETAPSTASGTLGYVVTGTWVPDPSLPSDPAPPKAFVQVSSLAWASAETSPATSTLSADDGLGDPALRTAGGLEVISSGTHILVEPSSSFTIKLNLSAASLDINTPITPSLASMNCGAITITMLTHGGILSLWDAADTWSTHLDFSDGNVGNLTAAQIAAQETRTPFKQAVGACADNASKILLEFDSLTPDPVAFSDISPPASPLYIIQGNPATNSQGLYVSYAVYSAPDVSAAFPPPGQGSTPTMSAPVTLTANMDGTAYNQPLTLGRPPVVLAHGLWDKGQTWINPTGIYSILQSDGFNVSVLDYQQTNHSSFATNRDTVRLGQGGIGNAIDSYHAQGWASSNADVIGHSMGGIITRYFASQPKYAKVDDYYKGSVHRLVTIGSPHFGSPQAELYYWLYLSTRQNNDNIAWAVLLGSRFLGLTSTPGLPGLGLRDLTPGSVALTSIHNPASCQLPAFAEIGNAGSWSHLFAVAENLGILGQDGFMGSAPGVMYFDDYATDTQVSGVSQQGGLAAPYFATVTNNTIHLALPLIPLTDEPHNAAIGQDIITQLYNDNFNFAGFPATTRDPNDGLTLPPINDPYASQVYDPDGLPFFPPLPFAATVAIAGPPAGQAVAPGASVDVTFTPNSGSTISWATASATDSNGNLVATSTATAAPFTTTLTIPQTTIGNVTISAVALDTAGNPSSTTTSVSAQTTATVQSLTVNVLNQPTFSGVGQSQQVQAMAAYSDNVSRDVTTSGTTYTSATPSVATVSSTGLVTAVGAGTSQITATNGSSSSTFIAAVNLQAPSLLAVMPLGAGAGQTVSLQLDGANFGGATGIQFLTPAGVTDPNITVSGLSLSGDSLHLTANVAIASNCPPEADTIVVTAAGGSSNPAPAAGSNVFTVLPPSNSLSLSSATASGVQSLTGTLTLTAPVSSPGGTVTLTSSDPSVVVPASITTYPGEISEVFPITTSEVTTPTTVTISAVYNGITTTATLTETP